MAKKKKNVSIFKIMSELLKHTFKCWPTVYTVYLIGSIIAGVMIGANAWVTQFFLDSVNELATGVRVMQETIFPVAIFILFMMGHSIVRGVNIYFLNSIGVRMHGYMFKVVARKAAKLSPILFEDPKMLDDIEKAADAAPQAFWLGDIFVGTIVFYLPLTLVMSIYLYTLDPLLVLIVVLSFLPKMVGVVIRSKLYTNLEDKAAPLRREAEFYENALVDRQFFKETRLLGAFGFFKAKFLKSVKLLNRETWRADRTAATCDLITEVITALSYLGTLYLLFISLQNGTITVGAFAAVFGTLNQFNNHLDTLINYNLAKIAQSLGKIGYLIEFLDLPEKTVEEKSINWQGDIEFKNVDFTYPNTEKLSLEDLSLTIKAGETVAIVGENGAGKSTFTKLLMGLYEPTRGEITVAGQRIKGIAPNKLHNGVSAVFQKYQRYQLTLKENIQISDGAATDEVYYAMEQSGIALDERTYPGGLDTILSREFDGIDLSGGQWQRVAIARGLYRIHDLIVLDEPTAAIDPLEESRLYAKFAEISKDKTAIIVTHRLGSAQIADKIIVLDDGKLIEEGNHQQLLAKKGHYAKMYESQASWYMN